MRACVRDPFYEKGLYLPLWNERREGVLRWGWGLIVKTSRGPVQNENVKPLLQKQEKVPLKALKYKAFPFSHGLSLDLSWCFSVLCSFSQVQTLTGAWPLPACHWVAGSCQLWDWSPGQGQRGWSKPFPFPVGPGLNLEWMGYFQGYCNHGDMLATWIAVEGCPLSVLWCGQPGGVMAATMPCLVIVGVGVWCWFPQPPCLCSGPC